ncbi:MAG: hypothetical protein CL943_03105 [Candidatus Diapherotrites archaeon]|uniref:HD domain-containing protein n=1 Tax=Candidatus Iainarchaeum sp. TaxID=3101447 RepID=A0A2D6M1H1_9ARCH|nr:hypothetical protein [Candidatus Diapherotrites archaeon]|tara:strand:+ start:2249 stop:2794 length:546 start_codon:yes stop_codon:yes gene_type:complete
MSKNIPTPEECIPLLKKYGATETIIGHLKQTAKVAVFLGKKLAEKGEEIDLPLLEASALLHDIDKKITLDDHSKKHAVEAEAILKKEGFPKIAEIVRQHRLGWIRENQFSGWEAKLVYYSDKRVRHDQIVSLEERFEYLLERYGSISKEARESILKAKPKVFELEEEIFSKIDVDKNLKGI